MHKLRMVGRLVVLGSALCAARAGAQGIEGLKPTADNPPTRQGTRGSNFLHLLVGARVNAMGGAVGTSVEGPTSWFINPAGAATSEGFAVAGGHQSLYTDLNIGQNYVGVSLPVLGGVVGIAVNSLSSGDIQRTSEAAPFGAVASGNTFTWMSTAASGGYARRLTDRLTLGGQIKYVTEGIPEANTSWVSFDVGTQFQTGLYGFVLSGAIQQVGGSARAAGTLVRQQTQSPDISLQTTGIELLTRETELPTSFRFSVGNELIGSTNALFGSGGKQHRLTAEVAMNDAVDLPVQMAVGAEYGYRDILFLRGGKRFYNDDRSTGAKSMALFGMSGGFGLRIPVNKHLVRFDYAFTSIGDLQNVQVFSLEFGR